MNDNYKIIISISHNRISFEYNLKGGDNVLSPIPPDIWPAPLAFFCNNTRVEIGEGAERAAKSGNKNAFTNYFDLIIQQDKFYEIGGEQKPIGKILLDASESIFRDFYSRVLLNRKGTLNDNRLNMPLTIVCDADISDHERFFLQETFRDNGYGQVTAVEYEDYIHQYILNHLSKDYPSQKTLVVWSEGTDLSLTLFDTKGSGKPASMIARGLGVDPRLNFVKNRIWEQICGKNPWIALADNESIIQKAAMDFLNSSQPMVNESLLLQDNMRYNYTLVRSNIDDLQSIEGETLRKHVNDFLNKNGIRDRKQVLLVLRGITANNKYFENNIGSGFFFIIRSNKELRANIMALIVNKKPGNGFGPSEEPINPPQPTKDPPLPLEPGVDTPPSPRDQRDFKELKQSVNTHLSNNRSQEAKKEIAAFQDKMHAKNVHAFDDELTRMMKNIEEVQGKEINSLGSESLPSGMDKRAFKIAKADAQTQAKNGKLAEAKTILSSFLDSMHNKRITAFDEEIQSLLSSYAQTASGRMASGSSGSNKLSSSEPINTKPRHRETPSAVEPTSHDRRDLRILQKQVETLMARDNKKAAIRELKIFADNMHKRGIYAFDADIKNIEKTLK